MSQWKSSGLLPAQDHFLLELKNRFGAAWCIRLQLAVAAWALLCINSSAVPSQGLGLAIDPQQTTINFTLGDVLHTVHGTFSLRRGNLHLDPTSGKMDGEIVVDAASGQSGSGMRDRKMHREVLQSDQFKDISFRPDHAEGPIAMEGKSSVQVHGYFNIHGSDHELTVPAEVNMSRDHWTAALHFAIPYAKWGMKNPSTLFLKVSESVDIDLTASGAVTHP